MNVSAGPHQAGAAPGSVDRVTPPPTTPRRHGRIWRRVLIVGGLVVAVFVDLFLLSMLAWLSDSPSNDQFASVVVRLAFLQLPILVVGFALCLEGSPRALRGAEICAAVFFLLALGIGASAVLFAASSVGGSLWLGAMFAVPDVLLVPAIVLMRPRANGRRQVEV